MAEKDSLGNDHGLRSGENTVVPSRHSQEGVASLKDSAREVEDLSKRISRIDSADYPSAWRLVMIVVALMLIVFLYVYYLCFVPDGGNL